MTEPKVEAGDRALARKCVEAVLLDTLGEACLNELDEPLIDEVAEMIQSAMNAQERALRRAYELAHIFAKKIPMLALSEKSYDEYASALKELAAAERLLAERGGTQ